MIILNQSRGTQIVNMTGTVNMRDRRKVTAHFLVTLWFISPANLFPVISSALNPELLILLRMSLGDVIDGLYSI